LNKLILEKANKEKQEQEYKLAQQEIDRKKELDKQNHEVEPDFTSLKLFTNNLIILPDLSSNKNTKLDFSFDLNIRGSNQLSFLHIGKNTTVNIEGTWKNPSFIGRYLPEQRSISDLIPTNYNPRKINLWLDLN
jgi:inner membrane protein involved in colicin E2 resistance